MASTFISPPLTNIQTEGYCTPDATVAVATMQGRRRKNEDKYAMNPYHGFYGVFDGHGGDECAAHVRNRLPDLICPPEEEVDCASHRSLFEDEKKVDTHSEAVRVQIQKVCLQLDHEIVRERKITSGSTAVFLKHDPIRQRVHLGNVGDSRFLWVQLHSTDPYTHHQPLKDHKPTDPKEEERIHAAGSGVIRGRVGGDLAVSRAFGDLVYKCATPFESHGNRNEVPLYKSLDQQIVTALPDTASFPMKSDDQKLALLFSDGLLESMCNDTIVDAIYRWKNAHYRTTPWWQLKSDQFADCAKAILREGLDKGSTDNMTLMMIYFRTGASVLPMFGKRKHLNPSYCRTGAHYRHWTDYEAVPVTSRQYDSDWSAAMKADIERYVDSRDVPLMRAPSPQEERAARGASSPSTPVIPEDEPTTLVMVLPATEPRSSKATDALEELNALYEKEE